jgi:hypothetical protein
MHAELTAAASRKSILAATPITLTATLAATPITLAAAHLTLATTTHLMTLPRTGSLWGGILRPTDNRCHQQNRKT